MRRRGKERGRIELPAIPLDPSFSIGTESGQEILRIFRELNERGKTVLLVTHDPAIAAHASRRVRIVDGRIVSDETDVAPTFADGGARETTDPAGRRAADAVGREASP